MGAGKKRKRFSGISIKDTWTKPKKVRMKGGRWGWLGWGEWWGEGYLNNNKKILKKKHTFIVLQLREALGLNKPNKCI